MQLMRIKMYSPRPKHPSTILKTGFKYSFMNIWRTIYYKMDNKHPKLIEKILN